MARTRGASGVRSALADPSLPPTVQLPRPDAGDVLDWKGSFDASRPLEVDIGCGLGRFLLARARAFPQTQYLGIEREMARVAKIDLAARREGRNNLRLLCADALEAVEAWLPPESVSAVYILFPDPWPKRRHWKRRLFSPAFLAGLHRILRTGGALHVATDQPDYFKQIRRAVESDPRFAPTTPLCRPPEEETDFERIFRGQGLTIDEASFLKCTS